MQSGLRGQTKPADIACVRRNLWPNQNNIKHAAAEIVDLLLYGANAATVCSLRIFRASPRRRQICEYLLRSSLSPLRSHSADSETFSHQVSAFRYSPASLFPDRVCVRAARSIRKVPSSTRG